MDLSSPPQPRILDIENGKFCDMCPFDHIWENVQRGESEWYVCVIFPNEPHRKEDYRNLLQL